MKFSEQQTVYNSWLTFWLSNLHYMIKNMILVFTNAHIYRTDKTATTHSNLKLIPNLWCLSRAQEISNFISHEVIP